MPIDLTPKPLTYQQANSNLRQIPVQFPTYQGTTLQPSPYGWQNPNLPGTTYDASGRINQVSTTGYDPITSGGLSQTGSLVGTIWDQNPNMASLNSYLLDKNATKIANMGVTTALAVPVNQPVGTKSTTPTTPTTPTTTNPVIPPSNSYTPTTYNPIVPENLLTQLPISTVNSGNTPSLTGGTSSINQSTTAYNQFNPLLQYLMGLNMENDLTTMPGQQSTNNPMDWYNTSFANY